MKPLSDLSRNLGYFFQYERWQSIVIISSFGLLFVCILLTITRVSAHRRNSARESNIIPTSIPPASTQTKWWIRHRSSETPVRLPLSIQTPILDKPITSSLTICPTYTSDFKKETFGYVSLYPSYENLVRSGAGKDYPIVGFIEPGDWVKILNNPVCTDDGYVWLKVKSAAGSSNWTAAGNMTDQWIIPCPDPNKKCTKSRSSMSISATPSPSNQQSNNDPSTCISDKLAVGLDAQVNPNDLLAVRSDPLNGNILDHISPLAIVSIIDGPQCAGGAVWWKVQGSQTGWAVENNLRACPKEGECDPWKNDD